MMKESTTAGPAESISRPTGRPKDQAAMKDSTTEAADLASAEAKLLEAQEMARAVYRRIGKHADADRIEADMGRNACEALIRVRWYLLYGVHERNSDGDKMDPAGLARAQETQEQEIQSTLALMELRLERDGNSGAFQVFDKNGNAVGE